MPRIALPSNEAIPAPSKPVLDGIGKQLGFVPNVVRLMSLSPAVLTGWAGLQRALGGRLNRRTREAIALVVSEVNGCSYCLAAHSYAAAEGHTPPEEIAMNRAGTSSDEAVAAAAGFAGKLVEKHGHITDADIAALRNAGYDDAEILEIVALAVQYLLTNFLNLVGGTEIDFPTFESAA